MPKMMKDELMMSAFHIVVYFIVESVTKNKNSKLYMQTTVN